MSGLVAVQDRLVPTGLVQVSRSWASEQARWTIAERLQPSQPDDHVASGLIVLRSVVADRVRVIGLACPPDVLDAFAGAPSDIGQ